MTRTGAMPLLACWLAVTPSAAEAQEHCDPELVGRHGRNSGEAELAFLRSLLNEPVSEACAATLIGPLVDAADGAGCAHHEALLHLWPESESALALVQDLARREASLVVRSDASGTTRDLDELRTVRQALLRTDCDAALAALAASAPPRDRWWTEHAARWELELTRAVDALREAATFELSLWGASAFAQVDEALGDPSWRVRAAAIMALWRLAPQYPSQSLPLLLRGLSDEHPAVQHPAAESLGQLGAQASAALPLLRSTAAELASQLESLDGDEAESLSFLLETLREAIAEIEGG